MPSEAGGPVEFFSAFGIDARPYTGAMLSKGGKRAGEFIAS
jgi:hypothetical protein